MSELKGYISDVIGEAEIATWKPGEVVLIKAPTGSGKSHFVKHCLYEHLRKNGQKCLFLLSRRYTLDQFKKELPEDDVIHYATYQAIENRERSGTNDYGGYSFIICDEAHYFTEDCKFNYSTDLSFDWIMSQNNAIRLLISATPESLEFFFHEQGLPIHKYEFTKNRDNIRSLTYFYDDKHLDKLAQSVIDCGQRGIFFFQNLTSALGVYERHKDNCQFVCSRHNDKYSNYMDVQLLDELMRKEKFNCALLVSTTALDVGFNIRDSIMATVVIDVTDPSSILQCLGRKRFIDDDDRIDLYIRARTNRQIGGMLAVLRKKLAKVTQFKTIGPVSYNHNHSRSNDPYGMVIDTAIVGNGTDDQAFFKEVHQIKLAHTRHSICVFQEVLNLGNPGFIHYMNRMLGVNSYKTMENIERELSLTQYLESIKDIPMLKPKDRDKLIEMVGIKRNGCLWRGYKTLSSWFEESGLPYRLHTYRKTVTEADGVRRSYKSVWVVIRIEDKTEQEVL